MNIFGFGKEKKSKEELKQELKMQAQMKQKLVKTEITKSKLAIGAMEQKMERKLVVAVNKAIICKQKGDKAGVKNAYLDIKMAMRFKAVATGTYSAMDRLESNLEFSNIASGMVETLEKAGELTGKNQMANVGKIDMLYQKVMNPLNNVVEMMSQFGEFNAEGPLGDMDITDEEVERVISQIAGGQKPEIPAIEIKPAAVQAAAAAPVPEKKEEAQDSVDSMISELNDLIGLLGK